MLRHVLAAFVTAVLGGCATLGVVDDGTTVSWGKANGGGITSPARLPDEGDGYRVPELWATRGLRYGTDELVNLIVGVGRRVELTWPDSPVTVADLSPHRGGPSQWHKSHQSGRDVDLVFFVTDAAGRHVDPDDMRHFDADGRSVDDGKPARLFDTARNWTLVRALIEYQGAEVQRIFIFEPFKQLLLDHARAMGESDQLVQLASEILGQPNDSAKHDDHMHIRILCSADDHAYGCRDYGPPPRDKKPAKAGAPRWTMMPMSLRRAFLAPMPGMLALVGLPILR